MPTYDFSLIYKIPPNIDPNTYLDPLYEAGSDDASIGMGLKGSVSIDFMRESESANSAIKSAIEQTKQVIVEGELCYLAPDIVGVRELANYMNCSKQNVQQIINANSDFPTPIYGNSNQLWHLNSVLQWLIKKNKSIDDIGLLLETAIWIGYYNNLKNQQSINMSQATKKDIEQLVCL